MTCVCVCVYVCVCGPVLANAASFERKQVTGQAVKLGASFFMGWDKPTSVD